MAASGGVGRCLTRRVLIWYRPLRKGRPFLCPLQKRDAPNGERPRLGVLVLSIHAHHEHARPRCTAHPGEAIHEIVAFISVYWLAFAWRLVRRARAASTRSPDRATVVAYPRSRKGRCRRLADACTDPDREHQRAASARLRMRGWRSDGACAGRLSEPTALPSSAPLSSTTVSALDRCRWPA